MYILAPKFLENHRTEAGRCKKSNSVEANMSVRCRDWSLTTRSLKP